MRGKQNGKDSTSEHHTIYAFAHCETWLEDYAKSSRLPAHELTQRVATLLLAQTGGTLLGAEHNLPQVRATSAQGSKTARSVALAHGARTKVQVKHSGKWTPARRKQYARRMKRNQAMLQAARKKVAFRELAAA